MGCNKLERSNREKEKNQIVKIQIKNSSALRKWKKIMTAKKLCPNCSRGQHITSG